MDTDRAVRSMLNSMSVVPAEAGVGGSGGVGFEPEVERGQPRVMVGFGWIHIRVFRVVAKSDSVSSTIFFLGV